MCSAIADIKKPITCTCLWYTFHRQIFISMPYALFGICVKLFHTCSVYVTFSLELCVAFEITIDFGILRCAFATALVIFVFRLIILKR